jgi:hypothetical protein
MGAAGRPRGEQRAPQALIRVAELSLPAVLAVGVAVAGVYAVLALAFGWELFIGESTNVSFAHDLAYDGTLYRDWGGVDLLFPIYTPGFYVAAAPLTWIAGNEPWAGRLVSILAVAAAAFAAGRIARRLGCNAVEAAVSSLAFFSLPLGALVLYAARPDGLAVGLAAAALLAATIWEDSRDRRALLAAVAASVALVLTRQNFAPIVLAILIAVWMRDRRAGLRFALGVAGSVLLVAAAAELLTAGAFLSNMRDFSDTGYSLAALRDVVKSLTLPYPNPILVVAAVEAALCLRSPRTARAIVWAWPAGVLVLLTAVKLGSSGNYVIALGLASGVLLGAALARLRRIGGASLAAGVAAALALLLLPQTIDSVQDAPEAPSHFSDRSAVNAEAVRQIEAAGGEVFGDRVDLAPQGGRHPGFDTVNHRLLAERGNWSPSGVAGSIRRRSFGAIQSSTDLLHGPTDWPPEIQQAVRAAYCPAWSALLDPDAFFASQGIFSHGGIWLYRPCDETARGERPHRRRSR